MNSAAPGSPVPYIAVIRGVREVALFGSADLEFWQGELARAGLRAAALRGRAQLALSAPDLRWSGIRFQELSLGVVVEPIDGVTPSMYLAHANNSSRLLAAMERALFQTPYAHCATLVQSEVPASIGSAGLRAAMAPAATRLWSREETWEGAIVLPARPRDARRLWFRARLGGHTDAYAFDPASDSFAIAAPAGDRLLQLLAASQFTPDEWRVRASGNHARSQTYSWAAPNQ